MVEIVNIVAAGKMDRHFKLNELAFKASESNYNPKAFPGLALRLNEPKTTFLIFSSGRIVCTGAKSMEEVKRAMNRLEEVLREAGIDSEVEWYEIQNIVAHTDVGRGLNLNALAILLLEECEYEPEQFSGLVYRLRDPRAVMLVFGTGRIVIVGCKKIADVKKAANEFKEMLASHGF